MRRCPSRTRRWRRCSELNRFDRLSVAERVAELELDDEERDVLVAELESVTHGAPPSRERCRSSAGTRFPAIASS